MPNYVSNNLIDTLHEQTEVMLHKAISEWQMLKHNEFGYKVHPDQWSANQCLAHLNSYGRYYLPHIERAIRKARQAGQQPVSVFKSGWLGNYFTNLMKPKADGSLAKKMASPKDHFPTANDNSYQTIAEFIEQQEKLLQLLEQARMIDLNRAQVPISIAKWIKLKLGDTFHFLVAHNQRHVLQAERALEAANLARKAA
ncbi:MAG: DinB family protein [Chitinophagaceae bacterium]|nr:DinB family protein [Chitinophagaceae bacterium]